MREENSFMTEKLKYDFYKQKEKQYEKYVNGIASVRLIVFVLLVVSFIGQYYYYPLLFRGVCIISFVFFVGLIFIHDYYYKIYDYYCKYVMIMESYIARERGDWKQFLDTGWDLYLEDKPFLSDLDIVGECSLFQYLTVCKTLGGREVLVNKLSNLEVSRESLKLEQEAIEELTLCPEFVIDFQVFMFPYEKKEVHLRKNFSCLKQGVGARKIDLLIGLVCSLICVIFFFLGYFHILDFRYFYAMFGFNFVMSFFYATIFRREFEQITYTIRNYGGVSSVIEGVVKRNFSSSKLQGIKSDMESGLVQIRGLKRIDALDSLKNNILSNFILNGFFCINLILLYQYARFLSTSLETLERVIQDVEELEALSSLATLGIVRDQKCMPVMCQQVKLKFSGLKHPLLGEKECVANDFSTSAGVQIITGSNMGGKTSFLRTIGINLLLMNAGCYVCAKSFEASYFKLFTSMRIADDIGKGISTFYGELLRIKDAVDYVDKGNMLVLIDEIFKGTNYQDRLYGAKEVIHRLNTAKTILFVTTHDFELCEEDNVCNYHVKEDYEGERIVFDYKIYKGRCKSTNAKYLMKKLGIIK